MAQMVIHQPRDHPRGTYRQRVDEFAMFIGCAVDARGALVERDDQRRARNQSAHDVGNDVVPSELGQQDVELAGQLDALVPVARGARGFLRRDVASSGAAAARAQTPHERPRKRRLDQATRRENRARLLDARLGDERPAIGMQRHDMGEREMMQRLAHARAAHAEQIGQCFLAELGARRQTVFFDRANDVLVDALRRLGLARASAPRAPLRASRGRAGDGRAWCVSMAPGEKAVKIGKLL